jgi:hypothetical protein
VDQAFSKIREGLSKDFKFEWRRGQLVAKLTHQILEHKYPNKDYASLWQQAVNLVVDEVDKKEESQASSEEEEGQEKTGPKLVDIGYSVNWYPRCHGRQAFHRT